MVLLCFGSYFAGIRRNRAKIRQMTYFRKIWCESRHSWRGSHQSPTRHAVRPSLLIQDSPDASWVQPDASRIMMLPPRFKTEPVKLQWETHLERLYKEVPWQDLDHSSFPTDSNQLRGEKSREEAQLEIAWRGRSRSQDWRISPNKLPSPLLIMICLSFISFTLSFIMYE